MPVDDFTNMEEAWDCFPASKLDGQERSYEATFYAGAQAVVWLISHGRSLRTIDMEIGDWLACHRERFSAKH